MSNFQHAMMPNRPKGPGPRVPAQPTKVVNVTPPEDESLFDDMADIEEQVAKNPELEKIVESSSVAHQLEKKRTLEMLVMFKMPKLKEFEISGVKFRLKRLNSDEAYAIYKEILKLPAEEQLSKFDVMTVAGALVDMNGIAIEELYSGPSEIKDPIIRRYLELCTWDSMLIQVIGKVYKDFVKEAETEFTPNFLAKK